MQGMKFSNDTNLLIIVKMKGERTYRIHNDI